ncbi:hypothetical protein [Variovorax boronicumulans]|uniref:hypothetical protein n=1 Tax=Variovorax boronicumulans TaxID=436515 RepID=UPI0027D8C195|nr:hypothetical protein [Variovorax boronicumulans]
MFSTPEDAVAFACSSLKGELRAEAVLPGVARNVQREQSFGWICSVIVATESGPAELMAAIPSTVSSPSSLDGKLCAVLVGPKPRFPADSMHSAVLIAELHPWYTPSKGWEIASNFS